MFDVFEKYPELAEFINKQGIGYHKVGLTMLRKISKYEVGDTLCTYIKTHDGIAIESTAIIKEGDIIARNPTPVMTLDLCNGKHCIYNQWLISEKTVEENYGKEVLEKVKNNTSGLMQCFSKSKHIKAIKLTKEIINMVNPGFYSIYFTIPGTNTTQYCGEGHYILSEGYGISEEDMKQYKSV